MVAYSLSVEDKKRLSDIESATNLNAIFCISREDYDFLVTLYYFVDESTYEDFMEIMEYNFNSNNRIIINEVYHRCKAIDVSWYIDRIREGVAP